MSHSTDDHLRSEIRYLGQILGDVISAKEGPEVLEFEERIRKLSKERRQGVEEAEDSLRKLLEECEEAELFAVCRAFSIFFDLANLAEDRHRIRILRERERARQPLPRKESIRDAVATLKSAGVSLEECLEIIRRSTIEPVFTAHPTEAKRRVIRGKLRRIRTVLERLERRDLLDRERTRATEEIRSQLLSMWETDLLRVKRPTVLEELDRSIYFLDSLWVVVPELISDLESALAEQYSEFDQLELLPLQFGTWIGGDGDGNPFVTPAVTLKTLTRLRSYTLGKHRSLAHQLDEVLTQSSVRVPFHPAVSRRLQELLLANSALSTRLESLPEEELYRRFVLAIDWRLEQTQSESGSAYRSSHELVGDLELLCGAVSGHRPNGVGREPLLSRWLFCARVFGFHTARLDIRQNADVYRAAAAEMVQHTGICDDYLGLPEEQRLRLLHQLLETPPALPRSGWSETTQQVVELFGVLSRYCERTTGEGLGVNVVSMTQRASDMLGLLWLQNSFAPHLQLPLVPLLETVDDLRNGPDILSAMWSEPAYASRLDQAGGRQMIMIGYSDSTKDSGYLSANWNLYQAQRRLAESAEASGVKLLFFHGRGGSLGRGGGPAARSILSLPVKVAREGLRVTEQGEVLSERYDDPAIAYRHLEQLIWAQLSLHHPEHEDNERLAERWAPLLDEMAAVSRKQYRDLLAEPGFLSFFRDVTPISEIEKLPIGSRPSRRVSTPDLENLRAIPWTFAWTQARIMMPAWFGLGKAISKTDIEALREMFREWSFFRALISNASLALSKADMGIALTYAERHKERPEVWAVWEIIEADYRLSVEQVLRITGEEELLGSVPWLAASIRRRNPYVDPLNLIQLRAFDLIESQDERGPVLMRLAIKGVAAGLRTTG